MPKKRTALAAKRRADNGVRGALNETGGDDVDDDDADSSETTTDGRLGCKVSEVAVVESGVVCNSSDDATADADVDNDTDTCADDDDDVDDDTEAAAEDEETDDAGSGRVGVARDRMRARL